MSEVYMEEIFFFTDSLFVEGQSIVIKFCVPEKFIMNADVTYCQAYSNHHRVLGQKNLPYRVCARFTFLRPGEKTLLRKFLSSIEPKFDKTNKPEENLNDQQEEVITPEMFEEGSDKDSDEAPPQPGTKAKDNNE